MMISSDDTKTADTRKEDPGVAPHTSRLPTNSGALPPIMSSINGGHGSNRCDPSGQDACPDAV